MRNKVTLTLALVSAFAIAFAAILSLTPKDTNSLTWRYVTIPDGTKADRQIDTILYQYPSRYVWPYRRTATSYSYYQDHQYGLPCIKASDPYEWRALCRAWEAHGPTNQFKAIVGIEVNWDGYGIKDEGWRGMEYRVYCNPIQAISVSLNPITCGALGESYSTVTLGWYFSTTTQTYKAMPIVTVWWKSYTTCYKYEGYCTEPITVPAG